MYEILFDEHAFFKIDQIWDVTDKNLTIIVSNIVFKANIHR